VSLIGGSRFQIGGPAGAFIALVAGTVERHGYDGLALATAMAGTMMIVAALLRAGSYIRYVPHAVIVGFTAGISVIIAASQIAELLGLKLAHEPADLVPKLAAIAAALPTVNPRAVALVAFCLAIILVTRRLRPAWPAFLIAIAAATAVAASIQLDVTTVASRFGEVPRALPAPAWPDFSPDKMRAVLPDALTIALLGSIESLLSALVADKMSGARHRSNGELGAQGVANIASILFGGICVTGTIARTATNVRAGSRGPVSGILHSGYLLLFLLIAAPLVALIPLGALAAMLIVVSWNMSEKREFGTMLLAANGETAVLLATFLLTIFVNLLTGIAAGCAIALALHWVRRPRAA